MMGVINTNKGVNLCQLAVSLAGNPVHPAEGPASGNCLKIQC
jgi:hypothetical protein